MYSYEDRMSAVELYIQLGKRIRARICQLGYPTKNAFNNWYRDMKTRIMLSVMVKSSIKLSLIGFDVDCRR